MVERELEEIELQRASLQAQVDAQDICPEDIDRMNADKDQLVRTLDSLSQAKEDASKVFWDRELQVQKKLDIVRPGAAPCADRRVGGEGRAGVQLCVREDRAGAAGRGERAGQGL